MFRLPCFSATCQAGAERPSHEQPNAKRPRPALRPHTAPQVVRAREQATAPKPAVAPLGEMLVEEFAAGSSSACRVQRTAASAMKWLGSHGGRVADTKGDTVAKLSTIGTSGKWTANAERDIHRFIQKRNGWLNAEIVHKQVRMVNPSTLEIETQQLPMILPHHLLLALWEKGEAVFQKCLFGDLSPIQVKQYWDHLEHHCQFFRDHPARSWHDRSKLVGIATYGDEVQAYKNSDAGAVAVCAFTSELAYKNESLLRYFPICIWSEHCECEHTYHDAMKYVVRSFRRLGDFGTQWPWSASGYHIAFTSAQGDLKWINERMNMHNYRKNQFCSRCMCVKTSGTGNVYESLTNFSDDPDAFAVADYSGVDLVRECFPVLQSKAAPSKVLTRWLSVRAARWAQRQDACQADKMVASCIFCYEMMLRIMDESGWKDGRDSPGRWLLMGSLSGEPGRALKALDLNDADGPACELGWQALADLGPVQHIVSPNYEHVKWAKQWKEVSGEQCWDRAGQGTTSADSSRGDIDL
eukprot:Skav222542  [mRNA]  locus=scaffold2875:264283:269599:+ [translate_table: standard]